MKNMTNQETIKPSTRTPSNLKLYNLSIYDSMIPNFHLPWVFFYKNYNISDINKLKKSLSKCLTQYYPFAGRLLSPSASHIECNDEGVEFLEASIDVPLQDFVLKRNPDETINKLIPNAVNESNPNMLEVQVNHFSCGGVAVAVSMSHKIADGFTMTNFVNHWATVTRGEPPINPTFVSSSTRNTSPLPNFTSKDKYTEKRYVFSNYKLGELKKKINNMGISPLNPTRVESLTSLLFKCAVNAATTEVGSFQPSNLCIAVNMRDKVSTVSPKSEVGNITTLAIAKMADLGDIQLNEVITRLRKDRLEIDRGVRDVEELGEMNIKKLSYLAQDQSQRTYICSSQCRFPIYQVDFGWGNPERVMLLIDNWDTSYFVLMDTATGDGIEAIVKLKEEEMALFQNNKEFLTFVDDLC